MVQGFTYWDNPKYPELNIDDFENKNDYEILNTKSIVEIIDYCIDNKIYISDYEHQSTEFHGVPVVDGYSCTFTLRAWSRIMADVWSKITGNNYDYLDFYCGCGNGHNDTLDGIPYNKPSLNLD